MAEMTQLKTNHNIRVVTITTGERILCLFGEVKDDERIVGYRLIYPFTLSLGDPNEDGSIPIKYTRWCPYSPIEEHRIAGDHIISVVYPDNGILDNYVSELKQFGFTEEQLFYPEETNGDNSEPSEAGE
jgi:hypothetical protein